MKKLILVLYLVFGSLCVNAGELYRASLEFNAESARKAAFENVTYSIPKDSILPYRFDAKIEENKNAMKYNLSLPDRDVKLYELPFSKSYGISYKKNAKYTYFYWHSSGYLKSVAIEEAPKGKDKFPVTIYRYNPYGELTAVSFQVSPLEEYIYNRDGTFNCHWINSVAYDAKGKKIGSSADVEEKE